MNREIDLARVKLSALHTSAEHTTLDCENVLRVIKTEKLYEYDTNSYVKVGEMDFHNGVIEVDVRSRLLPDAPALSRGFYLDKNVSPDVISRILKAMESAPTGGNSCSVEYTVIDDKGRVREIWNAAYPVMEANAKRHNYTSSFSDFYYSKMKHSEKTVRKDDLLFCGTPHLFIAHERCVGKWAEDSKVNCNLATAYFKLLANAFGLGTVIMSYPADVLQELAPAAREMLNIPVDHYMNLIVGFGYPEIEYARGVQKERGGKIHRWTQKKSR